MNFIVENYNWWRAGHIIFVIFWMASLLFLPRKFVYQFATKVGSEASKNLIEQQKKLIKIIMNPSLIGVWLFGVLLILANFGHSGNWLVFTQQAWVIKLLAVIIMTGFHMFYLRQHRQFSNENRTYSKKFWLFLNEAPALLSVLIVIVAVVYI